MDYDANAGRLEAPDANDANKKAREDSWVRFKSLPQKPAAFAAECVVGVNLRTLRVSAQGKQEPSGLGAPDIFRTHSSMAKFGIDLRTSGIDFSFAGIVDIDHFFE